MPAQRPIRFRGAALVAGLPLLAFGCTLAVLARGCLLAWDTPFARFAALDWYRQYLGARMPFRLAYAPFAPLDARWGDWRDAYAAYALAGAGPAVPGGGALLWRLAALALPAALALGTLGCAQLALARLAGPALAARATRWPRPLARMLAIFAALLPWAWALSYLAAARALLPPGGDDPSLAAFLLLGPANPALTKRHDLRVWAVVTAAATLWTAWAACLLPLAQWMWATAMRRAWPYARGVDSDDVRP
jgi:hypothetical protein